MTTIGIFALAGLAVFVAALVLAALGWAVSMPDGATRFTYRLWAWICGVAFLMCSFAASDRLWWNWVLTSISLFYCLSKIEHWWRQLELVRRFEREVAHHARARERDAARRILRKLS